MNTRKNEEFDKNNSSSEENKPEIKQESNDSHSKENSNLQEKEDLKKDKIFLLAEIENIKKRHLKEKSDLIKYSNQKLVSKMVLILDNYEIAVKTSQLVGDSNVKKFLLGISMAIEDFKSCLKDEGVEEYSIVEGKDVWDSRFCEVIDEVENENFEEGTIIELVKKGYFLNGRMIRPASVIISKKTIKN